MPMYVCGWVVKRRIVYVHERRTLRVQYNTSLCSYTVRHTVYSVRITFVRSIFIRRLYDVIALNIDDGVILIKN